MAKRNNLKPWIAAVLIVITAVFYFKVSDNTNKTPHNSQNAGPRYNVEKTGAGAVIDFTQSSQKIHSAVDTLINSANLSIKDVKENNKEIPRQQVEGIIRWHNRQILVGGGGLDVDTFKQRAAAALNNAGGEIIDIQPDNYQGLPVLRIDIGLRDNLGGDLVTIITDRIYLRQESAIESTPQNNGKVKGEMAIIIDDFGYSNEPINAFAEINRPLTFAVLPYRPHSSEAASRGLSSGHQVILHLPLEPLSAAAQSEQVTIGSGMSDSDIRSTAARAIQSIPGIIGVNNHQGSRATADQRVMRQVLSEIKSNNLFFVDSRTNSQSVAVAVARQMGVKTTANELFIDNENEVSAVKRQLRTAQNIALRNGSVVVIGHARLTTAAAVREMIPEIESSGIRLVFVSEMVR